MPDRHRDKRTARWRDLGSALSPACPVSGPGSEGWAVLVPDSAGRQLACEHLRRECSAVAARCCLRGCARRKARQRTCATGRDGSDARRPRLCGSVLDATRKSARRLLRELHRRERTVAATQGCLGCRLCRNTRRRRCAVGESRYSASPAGFSGSVADATRRSARRRLACKHLWRMSSGCSSVSQKAPWQWARAKRKHQTTLGRRPAPDQASAIRSARRRFACELPGDNAPQVTLSVDSVASDTGHAATQAGVQAPL